MNLIVNRIVSLALVACFTIFTVGCKGDSNTATVSGTVTLDGQPLKSGLIRFIPADGQTASADAIITDGSFSQKVPLGEKTVSITAPKVTGKRPTSDNPGSPMVDIVEELLPPKYNSATTLKLNVTTDVEPQKFDLQSK